MIVQLPAAPHLAAASLTGWTRRVPGAAAVLRGAVVLKAAFDLAPDPQAGAGAPLIMVPATDPARAAIMFSDKGAPITDGNGDVIGFDLRYEADTALEKARTDIVVEKWLDDDLGGCVLIDGAIWMQRMNGLNPASGHDAARNLFGWMSKSEEPRQIKTPQTAGTALPAAYDARFNNVYRRSTGFNTPEDRNTAPLPAGGTVRICRRHNCGDDTSPFTFRLPANLSYTARLRAYCGHGPDTARFWRIAADIPLVPDTLIAEPGPADASGPRATVLWRANWDYTSESPDTWRLIQVLPGGG
jgi:hypothetical protein